MVTENQYTSPNLTINTQIRVLLTRDEKPTETQDLSLPVEQGWEKLMIDGKGLHEIEGLNMEMMGGCSSNTHNHKTQNELVQMKKMSAAMERKPTPILTLSVKVEYKSDGEDPRMVEVRSRLNKDDIDHHKTNNR